MIKFKFEDIEIPENNPFQNCRLGRQPYATILENIVAYGKEGYVNLEYVVRHIELLCNLQNE